MQALLSSPRDDLASQNDTRDTALVNRTHIKKFSATRRAYSHLRIQNMLAFHEPNPNIPHSDGEGLCALYACVKRVATRMALI